MVKKGWTMAAPIAGCDLCPAMESADHLLLRCRHVNTLWEKLLLAALARDSPNVKHFVYHAAAQLADKRKWNVVFAACAVTLWHARNDRVFNQKNWTSLTRKTGRSPTSGSMQLA